MGLGEQKAFNTITSNVDLPGGDNGAILASSFNLVSVGTGVNNMLGDSITITAISLNFLYDWPGVEAEGELVASDLTGTIYVRVALVLDTQANGTTPAYTDIYFGTGGNTIDDRAMNYKNRFRVLKEWLFPMTRPWGVVNNVDVDNDSLWLPGVKKVIKYYKKCRIRIDYATQAGGARTISEVRSNNLLLVGGTTATPAGGGVTIQPVNIDVESRIRFLDN